VKCTVSSGQLLTAFWAAGYAHNLLHDARRGQAGTDLFVYLFIFLSHVLLFRYRMYNY